ncbi:MAG: hypothetical protein IK080_01270 [Clostridia bacterium]|nr:hypothetical protein [Clostridia bacterium]
MKRTCKKTLACLLAALMLCAALPLAAFAGGDELEPTWQNYISKIEIASGTPKATVKDNGRVFEFTAWEFPTAYRITTTDGAVLRVESDTSKITDPYSGDTFEVEIGDAVIEINAHFMYEGTGKASGIKFYIMQHLKDGDTEVYFTITQANVDGKIDRGGFFERIGNFFYVLKDRIGYFISLLLFGRR